jgi:hypothetical protein
MRVAEIIVGILLIFLLIRPTILKRVPKIGFVILVAYLAHENLALGCLAAIVFIRMSFRKPSSWSAPPPRVDRIGIDTLLRPQESFFQPTFRTAGDPIAELFQPFTLF